jgi:eukaryotic-like serine/threonine-protein kinase
LLDAKPATIIRPPSAHGRHPMGLQEQLRSTLGSVYKIDRELDGAGMSQVFVAHDDALGRDVVIKILPPELAASVSAERFRLEIQVAASLQHPHIVPVLTAGEMDGLPYYTMPLVAGRSLRERLKEGQLDLDTSVGVLRDVARALAFAHRSGIVHRDLKPENVLLSDGVALVTDFGIARAISAARAAPDERLTAPGLAVGTPSYMAPEQAAGDPSADQRVDIYAFGVLAYELLTGLTPFHDRSPRELAAARATEVPPPLRGVRPETPGVIQDIVMQCLENDPDRRPANLDQIVKALDAYAVGAASGLAWDEPRQFGFAVGAFGVSAALVAVGARLAMLEIGLPDWFLPGALALIAVVFPVLLVTGAARLTAHRAWIRALGGVGHFSGGSRVKRLAGRASGYLRWPVLLNGSIVALGAFVLFTSAFMGLRAAGIGPAGSLLAAGIIPPNSAILVADFSAAPEDSIVARVATEAVRVGVQQSNVVRVVSPSTIADALKRMRREPDERVTLAIALEIARREGYPAVIDGDLVRDQKGILLTARLVASDSGHSLASASASAGASSELLQAATSVMKKLRGRIGESLKLVRASPPLARVTTSSYDALAKYTEAHRLNLAGDYEGAVKLLEEAVEHDSTFAMAWRLMSVARSNAGLAGIDPGGPASPVERAFRHRQNLTDIERLRVEANYYINTHGRARDRGRGMRAYEELIARDSSYLNNYAWYLLFRREWARSESLHRATFRWMPNSPIPIEGFIMSLVYQGKFEAADSAVAELQQEFPEQFATRRVLQMLRLEIACERDDLTECDRLTDSVRAHPGSLIRAGATRLKARAALQRGRVAEHDALQAEANSNLPARAREETRIIVSAANEVLTVRRHARALRLLDSLPPDDSDGGRGLPSLMRLYAMAGAPNKSRALLQRYDSILPDSMRNEGERRFVQWGLAEVALAEKRYQEAIVLYRASDHLSDGPVDCDPLFPWQLGRAFDASGQRDSAIAMYRAFLLTHGYPGVCNYKVRALAPTLERLGELYDEAGQRRLAIEYYQKFINLWHAADPILQPRVARARSRVASLRKELGA